MPTTKLPRIPDAIYFDTDSLRSLPCSLDEPWIETVIAFSKKYGTQLVIPEVAYKEWVHALVEAIDQRRLPDTLASIHRRRIGAAGFAVVPTPDLGLDQLIDEAIGHISPFEKGDKGFRDTVIMETIAGHAASLGDAPVVLVVSKDAAIQRSGQRLADRRVVGAITAPDEVLDLLDAAYRATLTTIRREDAAAALRFLQGQEAAIFEFVRRAQVSVRRLQERFRKKQEPEQPEIESVDGCRPIRVTSARPGFPTIEEGLPPDRYPLPFSVEVEFDLRYRSVDWQQVLGGPTIPLDRPVLLKDVPRFGSLYLPDVQTATFRTEMRVDATVSAEGAEQREFKDLRMTFVWL
jgi:hypothetical protein